MAVDHIITSDSYVMGIQHNVILLLGSKTDSRHGTMSLPKFSTTDDSPMPPFSRTPIGSRGTRWRAAKSCVSWKRTKNRLVNIYRVVCCSGCSTSFQCATAIIVKVNTIYEDFGNDRCFIHQKKPAITFAYH